MAAAATGASAANTRATDSSVSSRIVASSVGALLTSLFVTPFDVVKTRLQMQTRGNAPLLGTRHAIVHIASHEGAASLWRGLQPTLAMALPATVLYYSMYEHLRDSIELSDLCRPYAPLLAGASARMLASFVTAPLELIKTNLQAAGSIVNGRAVAYTDTLAVVRAIVRERGVRGMFLGMGATFYRDVPFSAIYWASFEALKHRMDAPSGSGATGRSGLAAAPQVVRDFVSGAAAGTVAAFVTTPIDVVKTTMQVDRNAEQHCSMLKTLGCIVRREGVAGLFKGLVPRLAKIGPACAIMISTYELLKSVAAGTVLGAFGASSINASAAASTRSAAG